MITSSFLRLDMINMYDVPTDTNIIVDCAKEQP